MIMGQVNTLKVTNNLDWLSHIVDVGGKDNRAVGFLRHNFKHRLAQPSEQNSSFSDMTFLVILSSYDTKAGVTSNSAQKMSK